MLTRKTLLHALSSHAYLRIWLASQKKNDALCSRFSPFRDLCWLSFLYMANSKKLVGISAIRIHHLKHRREVQVAQLRRDIAQLLHFGKEQSARMRLPRLWKEQKLLVAYDIIGHYCDLVIANLSIIAEQRLCPVDFKEPLSSLVFATSRCGDLPELRDFREILALKYGKEFIAAVQQQRPEAHLNEVMVECFDSRDPSGAIKQELLESIATEYNFPPEFLSGVSISSQDSLASRGEEEAQAEAYQGMVASSQLQASRGEEAQAEAYQGMVADSHASGSQEDVSSNYEYGSQEDVSSGYHTCSQKDLLPNYLLVNYVGKIFVAKVTHPIGGNIS